MIFVTERNIGLCEDSNERRIVMPYIHYSFMPVMDSEVGIVIVTLLLLVALFSGVFFLAEVLRKESIHEHRKDDHIIVPRDS